MLGQRKIANYLSHTNFAKRYYFYAFVVSLIFAGAMEIYAVHMLRDIGASLAEIPGINMGLLSPIYERLINVSLLFVSSFLVFTVLAIFFVMFIEQRVGGPTVAILRYIDELKKGNYTYRRNLRNSDELKNVMQALEELSQVLAQQSNHGTK